MVLAGKVNKELVSHLIQHGGKALGMCGIDGQMILCHKIEGDVDLGFVGEIDKVNTTPILDALEISPLSPLLPAMKRDRPTT